MGFIKLRDLYGKEIKIPANAAGAYRNLGFYPVNEFEGNETSSKKSAAKSKAKKNEVNLDSAEDDFTIPEAVSEKTEDEIFVETVTKKPLASWNKEEVKRYAGIFNIDLSGTKSANDAKERIKEFMSEAE
jgi:hypothetical protein